MTTQTVHVADIHDVAAYLISQFPTGISSTKLQKLTYLANGWHLALTNQPLVTAPFEAWKSGPVNRDLLEEHKGLYTITSWKAGDLHRLTQSQKVIINAVVKNYGALSGPQLSELADVRSTPWIEAVRKSDRGSVGEYKQEIQEDTIQVFFKRRLRL